LEFLAKLELTDWAFLKVTKLELNFWISLRVGVKVRVAYFGRDKMFKVKVTWWKVGRVRVGCLWKF
jgi:hypothetical protein